MNSAASFGDRMWAAWPLMSAWFGVGFTIALWGPHPKLILTVATGISVSMLALGPCVIAVTYFMRLHLFVGGHLRWPICLLLAVSAVFLLDYFLHWSKLQIVLAGVTASVGSILGHDATMAVLELRASSQSTPDYLMVVLFPLCVGLAVLAGYCSLAFGVGVFNFAAALV